VALSRPQISACMRDIDEADAILVLGTDPLHAAPILDLRIRKAVRRHGAKLAVATERPTALDGGAAAAVRYAPGMADVFLEELESVLAEGGSGDAAALADVLSGAERVLIVWGERVGRGDSGQAAVSRLLALAERLRLAETEGSGLLEVPDVTNARGLREVGCLPDAAPGLAETAPGHGTEEIREALESGELKAVLLFGVDPLRDFPDGEGWRRALGNADHVVAFSLLGSASTGQADVIFPLESHAEKDGTVTHFDGRLQRLRPNAASPGDVRPGWQVLAELAVVLGHETGIESAPDALTAVADAVPFYAGLSDSEIGGRGVRWQDRPAAANLPELDRGGGVPSREDSAFRDGSPPPPPASNGELALGTYRDLWAGPVTEHNPALRFLEPQQTLELALADAERLGISDGDEVTVGSNGTSVRARVAIRERGREGACFLIEGTAADNANLLVDGRPASVRVEKAET
jgi:NADH-quinone oxidoreductase subunit G